MSGHEDRPTWEDLVSWFWGPGLMDRTPGLVVDKPDPTFRLSEAEWWAARAEAYAVEERKSIVGEGEGNG